MPYGDLSRIYTNIGALKALNSLNYVNRELMIHQTRLATGQRINEAAEGPAEYSIAKDLEATARRWEKADLNVRDAYSFFSTAESGIMVIKDILIRMSELTTQASSDLVGDDDRNKIRQELQALVREIDQTVDQTKWRGKKLLDGTYSAGAGRQVWVGPSASAEDALPIYVTTNEVTNLKWQYLTGITVGQINVSTSAAAQSLLASINHALADVDTVLAEVGNFEERLNTKETRIGEHEVDVWSSYSRIMNADMAEEQLKVTTFTILQQAAVAGLAAANTAPSFILGLLGR